MINALRQTPLEEGSNPSEGPLFIVPSLSNMSHFNHIAIIILDSQTIDRIGLYQNPSIVVLIMNVPHLS